MDSYRKVIKRNNSTRIRTNNNQYEERTREKGDMVQSATFSRDRGRSSQINKNKRERRSRNIITLIKRQRGHFTKFTSGTSRNVSCRNIIQNT